MIDRYELAHQMDLVPLLAVFVLARWRELPEGAWLLAGAWLVSWFGSAAQYWTGGEWWTAYLWLPVQFTLALSAFVPAWWPVWLGGTATLAYASASVSAPGPELLLSVVGSIAVLVVARGPLRLPVHLYWGLGTVCYVLMVERIGEGIVPGWSVYQLARALAYVAFVVVLLRSPRTRET